MSAYFSCFYCDGYSELSLNPCKTLHLPVTPPSCCSKTAERTRTPTPRTSSWTRGKAALFLRASPVIRSAPPPPRSPGLLPTQHQKAPRAESGCQQRCSKKGANRRERKHPQEASGSQRLLRVLCSKTFWIERVVELVVTHVSAVTTNSCAVRVGKCSVVGAWVVLASPHPTSYNCPTSQITSGE